MRILINPENTCYFEADGDEKNSIKFPRPRQATDIKLNQESILAIVRERSVNTQNKFPARRFIFT